MGKGILMFGNIKIEEDKFYCHKSPIAIKASSKIFSGEKNYKYFIGYLYEDYKVKLLHIMLLKTSAFVKSCDGRTKWMYFLTEDDDLLEKYIFWG